MNVYQAVEHFDEEVGLNLLIDSMFGEEGAIGGFPLPPGTDGRQQALVYDEYGMWFITQSASNGGGEDAVRFFPFEAVTACDFYLGPGARETYRDQTTSFGERSEGVLRSTSLELIIAGTQFTFDGAAIAETLTRESYHAEVLGDLFAIVRHCSEYGVPVQLTSEPVRELAGAVR